jgi:hypothetical protein
MQEMQMKFINAILGMTEETHRVRGQEITPFSVAEDYIPAKLYNNFNLFWFPQNSWLKKTLAEQRAEKKKENDNANSQSR